MIQLFIEHREISYFLVTGEVETDVLTKLLLAYSI